MKPIFSACNGEKRPILRGEYNGKNYQELLESEPKKK